MSARVPAFQRPPEALQATPRPKRARLNVKRGVILTFAVLILAALGGAYPLLARGDHKRPEAEVPRAFLEALDATPYATTQSGRLQLAEDLLRAGNPLTRRVIANRLWHHVVGRGIAATTGVATTQVRSVAFRVRPAFRASFTCDRVNKDAQCIPILPMTLNFSAPIAAADAAKVRLVDASGKAIAATVTRDPGASGVTSLTFGPGLPERQRFRIELPPGLKDDAGRSRALAHANVPTESDPDIEQLAAFLRALGVAARLDVPILVDG